MAEMKRQDEAYLAYQAQVEAKRARRLGEGLHFLPEDDGQAKARHLVFVDDEDEARQFDAATFFDTTPDLLGRTFNRPTRQMLEEDALLANPTAATPKTLQTLDRERAAAYGELTARKKREDALKTAMEKVRLKRQLMGKGRVKKANKGGKIVYRWAPERKK